MAGHMTTRLSRHCVLAVAVVAVLSVGASVGLAAGWPGSNDAIAISGNTSLLARGELYVTSSDIDLAAFSGGLVAAWPSGTDAPGIVTATMTGGTWDEPSLISEPKRAWAPSITHDGSGLSAVWARGDNHENPNVARSLIGFDAITGTQVIAAGFYGQTSPDLATSLYGDYLVYAAVETDDPNSLNATSTDLYFAFRPSHETDWPDPQVIVSATTVVTNAVTGGISSPQVVIVSGAGLSAEVVHIVWQQNEKRLPSMLSIERQAELPVYTSIWHVRGHWAGGRLEWDAPEKLSPEDQRYAVAPAVTATGDGEVHITWTELIGTGLRDADSDQYIHYRLLGTDAVTNIGGPPVVVNSAFPSWSISSVAARFGTVCAVWHGHTEYDNRGSTYEEISVRCSKDGGQTWLHTVQASETEDDASLFPKAIVDTQGSVHLIWVEYGPLGSIPEGVYYRTGNPVHATFLPLVLRAR